MKHFTRHFDNFFLSEIFQWHLKTPKDDRSGKELFVTMYVILELGHSLSVCPEVYWRHPCVPWYGFCLDSAAITGSKKHISSSNGIINLENLKSEKEIKSCVIVKFYRRICWFVCWFLFSSEATRSSVEALASQASVFFSSLLKGSLITSE